MSHIYDIKLSKYCDIDARLEHFKKNVMSYHHMHTWSWRTLRRYAHSLRFPVGLYDTKKIHQMVKYIHYQISVTMHI